MFQQPSQGGDRIVMDEVNGSLALVIVREYREHVATSRGDSDAIAADVHILDGPKAGEVYENTLLFQRALVGSLRGAIGGDPVLGRFGQGTAKPGQTAPWILNAFTQADLPVATAYWTQYQARQFQAPATAPAAPPPAAGPPLAAAVSSSPAPASPATGNGAMTAQQFAALPLEVQELLRQSGQAPVA